ncbi:MAG TPA: S8 family peptidase [Caldilineaceae bacterium]|mgnify:CR=1 FL=1|nr:S8 family peptidase [Caldilineaceae bacterium]
MLYTTRPGARPGMTSFKNLRHLGISLIIVGAMLVHGVRVHAQTPEEAPSGTTTVFLPLVASAETGENEAEVIPEVIPGQYIVVFKEEMVLAANASEISAEMAVQYGGELLYTYDAALQGFAAQFPLETSAETVARLQQDERVAYVEPDAIVSISQESKVYQKPPLAAEPVVESASVEEVKSINEVSGIDTVQYSPVWGLDRNDQRYLPLNGQYIYFKTGTGVRAYIIDTGIRITHSDFAGRASYGYDAVDGSLPAGDCNGHGTHVAGTVGGKTYGVAKGVRLIAVRVLKCDGSGSISGVIAGVNWVTNQKRLYPSIPSVANMSLGGAASSSLDTAVYNSIKAGVTYVVAAGNANANACNYSPARTAGTITVGATTSTDTRASFSNYGGCVDIFAPGVSIKSTWYSSDSATNTLNGTSMATPHVTGVVALYLQGSPSATPSTVRTTIFSVATAGIVKSAGSGSYNRLVYNPY